MIELADGSRQRVEELTGHRNVFASNTGGPIAGVWVKAGANFSGDGPGYGERFIAPTASCGDAGTAAPPVQPPQTPPSTPPQTPPVETPTPDTDNAAWVD